MSRVLVIGATGLLGAPVAQALTRRGHEVHRASRNVELSPTSHRLDLTDVDETHRVLKTVHPAVVVQMTGGMAQDPVRLAEINIVPTVNLMRAAARSDEPLALFVSGSAAEYGDPGKDLASEEHQTHPMSPYGWVKVAEIATARELARLHGLDLTVIRPFNPVLPELPRATALGNFRHQILTGEGRKRTITCGRVDVIRDFVTSTFVGDAVAELVEYPPGGIINICSGVGVRLGEVMGAAAILLDVELELEEDPILAGLPAPSVIVGDPRRLHSLIEARANSTPDSLASALLGPSATGG